MVLSPAGEVVWEYPTKLTHDAWMLPSGNVLFADGESVTEVTPEKKVVFRYQPADAKGGGNYACQRLPGGKKEYTPGGKVAWQVQVPGGIAFAACRTDKGTTLVSSLDQVSEFDEAGKIVWQCATTDVPESDARNFTGIHLLPNGNVLIGCYQAYKDKKGSALLEISRDKKIVWTYSNPAADSTMMAVQILSPLGELLAGACLR